MRVNIQMMVRRLLRHVGNPLKTPRIQEA
jgi:hypothetical protein